MTQLHIPTEVPNLGALNGGNPIAGLLANLGLQVRGRVEITTLGGTNLAGTDLDMVCMPSDGGLAIVAVLLTDGQGQRRAVPWAAIETIGAA